MSARQIQRVLLLPRDHRPLAHALAPDNAPVEILAFPEELAEYAPLSTLVIAVADTREELEELKKLATEHSLPVKAIYASETGKTLEEWTQSTDTVKEFLTTLIKLAGRTSQKSKLLSLIDGLGLELFHDQHDIACARFKLGGHKEHYPINSIVFKRWIQAQHYKAFGEAINNDALRSALGVLEGKALFEGEEHPLEVRSVWHEGALWIDLCDKEWRIVKVTERGWEIIDNPPILFKRFPHQAPLPMPKEGGNLRRCLDFLNVRDGYGNLLLVWLVSAFIPDMPRPIITVHGGQGSGKSTLGCIFKKLIDPSFVELHRFPKEENELVQALSHHALMVFDNVDGLSAWASDCLCRAITGGGHQKRRLYSDDEDILYNFKRAIILNGINLPSARPDLLDRSILIRLDRIPWEKRRTERELWKEFERLKPRLFGAILDALSQALAIKPTVDLPALPRMADWAEWGYAIAEALGIGGPKFLEVYASSIRVQNEEVLAGHPVAQALLAFMEDREEWEGSPSELFDALSEKATELKLVNSKAWPRAPHTLTRKLNTLRVNLEEVGISILENRSNKTRTITITATSKGLKRHKRHSVTDQENQGLTSDAIKTQSVTESVTPKLLKNKGGDACDGSDAIFPTSGENFAKGASDTCGEERPGAQTEEGTPSSTSPASEVLEW